MISISISVQFGSGAPEDPTSKAAAKAAQEEHHTDREAPGRARASHDLHSAWDSQAFNINAREVIDPAYVYFYR